MRRTSVHHTHRIEGLLTVGPILARAQEAGKIVGPVREGGGAAPAALAKIQTLDARQEFYE